MKQLPRASRFGALGQFVRFLLSGGAAALVNYGSRFVFSEFLPYVPSIALAFLAGLATGFALMRAFVFVDAGKLSSRQVALYVIVNLVGLLVTVGVSVLVAKVAARAIDDIKIDEAIGHLFGVCAPVLVSYFAHKHFTFR
jgi:putative flippase GtrA